MTHITPTLSTRFPSNFKHLLYQVHASKSNYAFYSLLVDGKGKRHSDYSHGRGLQGMQFPFLIYGTAYLLITIIVKPARVNPHGHETHSPPRGGGNPSPLPYPHRKTSRGLWTWQGVGWVHPIPHLTAEHTEGYLRGLGRPRSQPTAMGGTYCQLRSHYLLQVYRFLQVYCLL